MDFSEAVLSFWSNYANFKGRSNRRQFWNTVLFMLLSFLMLSMIELTVLLMFPQLTVYTGVMSYNVLNIAYVAITVVPWLALWWRRMHDVNRTGSTFLLILIPVVGLVIVTVYAFMKSDPKTNRYGTPIL